MDFNLTAEQEEIRQLTRQLVEKHLKPVRAKLDEEEEYPTEFIQKAGEMGLLGIYIPEAYGGIGQGVTGLALAMEEISRICTGSSTVFGANALGALPILLGGTEEQKQKYLPKLATGELWGAFGLTESGAGSDALAMKTTAVRDGDHYILNGSKQFITNAGQAQIYSVFAMTNPARGGRGVSGFIVEEGMLGFTFGHKEKKMGIRCSETRSLEFKDCRVPAENLIGGKEGYGAIQLLLTLNKSRIGIGAQGVGLAQGAFEEAMAYARQRQQFNQNISSFQVTQHKFANMAMLIEAARLLVYKAATLADADAPKDQVAKFGAMSKCFGGDTAVAVALEAIQICGGIGYMRDFPVEKYLRDAKIIQIYEGTNEIQRNEIAAILIKEAAK